MAIREFAQKRPAGSDTLVAGAKDARGGWEKKQKKAVRGRVSMKSGLEFGAEGFVQTDAFNQCDIDCVLARLCNIWDGSVEACK